jgi:hypothetical protein
MLLLIYNLFARSEIENKVVSVDTTFLSGEKLKSVIVSNDTTLILEQTK